MMYLPISLIRVGKGQRQKLASDKLARHRAAIQNGDTLPIEVRQLHDGSYVIAGNGRHRFFAYCAEGVDAIPCRVHSEPSP